MRWQVRMLGLLTAGAALLGAGSCVQATDFFNTDFLSGLSGRNATLPGEAPGLLVAVENRTTRPAEVIVSYRDGDDAVTNYTTFVSPQDKNQQLLLCPITEITVGSVANLEASGAIVSLVPDATTALDQLPYIEVDAFGSILREAVNFDCGDEVLFVLDESTRTSSGYEIIAFIRRAPT